MSLRLKLAITMVVLSVAASVSVGLLTFRATTVELRGQLDKSLASAVEQLSQQPLPTEDSRTRSRLAALRALRNFRAPGDTSAQVIGPRGVAITMDGIEIPVESTDVAIAQNGEVAQGFRSTSIDGQEYRMLTRGLGNGAGAVQVVRSTQEIRAAQRGIARRIVLSTLAVAAVAGLAGWMIARQATRRLIDLTSAAEEVASTADPGTQVSVAGTDETARLATAFNRMLASLAEVREDQRRLVQNAGHELKTPLTSLRTNIYTLRNSEGLTDDDREAMLDDLKGEAEELTNLVNEVIELATEGRGDEEAVEVNLGALVEGVARRASRRSGVEINTVVDSSVVTGRPGALTRSVSNLIENAIKFGPERGRIDVECASGAVAVSDRGPGLSEADIPRIFERFYRADVARSLPGSGLGLSIVAEIVESHNGYVWAHNRDGGGAVIGFTIPVLR